ncbi:monovalent cation:proton antiporter-2 (CPA2) family protein [Herbaspirillum sp. SJZ130]|nr:monovalent cation:proton antiporter-2 (CPA2) family protein [Herbaspirillum sp. SJZ102]TQK09384.1 monovalent cation:proton antiporter-2 (CPA2) family protein [Herbaspirillum sp. SJZ130]TQK13929.1 monovalent cation:proton antiporter-2 (CPA2) family protein [Herbaspirillum sp. SJZ106]
MDEHLLKALVYLLAAVAAVPIAKRLGLGAVLGYLLAGIVIGPWGLGLITEVKHILEFSEFGVVLLLFLIGLELDPKRLWALRRSIFGWGSVQVLAVTSALLAAALAAGVPWRIGLIAALGMSLSSTAIALATLGERKLTASPAGAAGFSILLFQDIAAIPMMAAVPLLGVAASQGSGQGWLHAGQVALVIALLIFGGRVLMRPILRIIAKTDMREIFTAFALLLVIATCLLMQSVGMSMALGTFLAGVLLADSEYRHALESDLEPFKGLLLGLFFIAVGMSVDFGVFLAQPWRILGLVAAFLAIKTAVMWCLGRCFGIPRGQQLFFAFLLSQGGDEIPRAQHQDAVRALSPLQGPATDGVDGGAGARRIASHVRQRPRSDGARTRAWPLAKRTGGAGKTAGRSGLSGRRQRRKKAGHACACPATPSLLTAFHGLPSGLLSAANKTLRKISSAPTEQRSSHRPARPAAPRSCRPGWPACATARRWTPACRSRPGSRRRSGCRQLPPGR